MRFILTLYLLQLLYIFTLQLDIPSIDDSQLGFIGNYAGISQVKSNLQFESMNNISTFIVKNDENIFEKQAIFDGNITSYCTCQNDIYLGGHFTTVNQTILSNHIVKYNTQSNQFQSLLQGLNGPVYTLYCDKLDQILYVGGNFSLEAGNNVAQWNMTDQSWSPLPWKGFNGPVHTITKNTKYNTLLFGGQFDATEDGQLFNSNTSQIVPMSSSTSISSGNGLSTGNPKSIVCPYTETSSGPWYLQDGVPGYWDANFINPIEPTVFRLSNTHTDRGTISFNILALGSNEYFELSYIEPITQQIMRCSEDCILSNATYQDFTVLSTKSASGIRININSWFGSSGGLGNVQIFQSDISVNPHLYANQNSQCTSSASPTQTTISGNWEDVYVYGYYQTILQATTPYSSLSTSDIGIIYEPNIPAQGQYDIYATTPGCIGSSNCFQRTQVQYELTLSPGYPPTTILLDQNTFADQKTLLYSGPIFPATSNFKPTITLKPAPNATQPANGSDNVSIMADTIELVRNTTAASLVSILEYSPEIERTNYDGSIKSWKPLNQQLPLGSTVYSIDALNGDILYIGGSFSNTEFNNIVSYDTNEGTFIPMEKCGINAKVSQVLLRENSLYVAGDFNATELDPNARYIVEYDTIKKTWNSLGNGVDGPVNKLSFSNDILTVSGSFHHRSGHLSIGNALWNTRNKTWIERDSLIVGDITIDAQRYLAGNILGAQTHRADIVTLNHYATLFTQPVTLTAGVTWINNITNTPMTILAGYPHSAPSNTTIYMYDSKALSTIDHVDGQVHVLAVLEDRLFVGGQFTTKYQTASLAMYDLLNNNTVLSVSGVYDAESKPGIVHVIKSHPDGKRVVVGGRFNRVGLFECNAICVIDPLIRQWNQIAAGLEGTVYDAVTVHDQLTVVGELNGRHLGIAKLEGTTWVNHVEMDQLPGIPTMALRGINNEIIISGTTNNNDVFLGSFYDDKYTPIQTEFGTGTNISQILFVPISSFSNDQRFPSGTQNMLLVVGDMNLTQFGQVSAALYDGVSWYPYLLTTQLTGKPGTIHRIVHTTDYDGIRSAKKYLSVAAVILISIAISAGILFAMSAITLLILYKKHKNAQGPEEMPAWIPSPQFLETLGLLGTGTLGKYTIAATKSKGSDSAVFDVSTSRPLIAGPSQLISRSTFQQDDAVSPTTTIVTTAQATSAAAEIVPFSAMVAATQEEGPITESSPRLFYAKYPFKAQEFGELSFEAGDVIVVTDTTDAIWWLGYKDNGTNQPTSGVFPSNYVSNSR